MKAIIDDLFAIIERLNNELNERIEFEHHLVEIISQQIEKINKLEETLNIESQKEEYELKNMLYRKVK